MTAAEATDKDFERMMQKTGFFVTQIAGAVATYSIADHLAKGPATAEQISTIEGIDPSAALRLLRACASPVRTESTNLPQGSQCPGADQAIARLCSEPATSARRVPNSGVARNVVPLEVTSPRQTRATRSSRTIDKNQNIRKRFIRSRGSSVFPKAKAVNLQV
jgi:hypothetical protein